MLKLMLWLAMFYAALKGIDVAAAELMN